jgi:glutathione-regulated potassium-efflux system ancillary protein KefF
MVLLIYAHPQHSRSAANRALLEGVLDLPGLVFHPLYDRYPDFSIDAAAERDLLTRAQLVVWQHPLYWYSVPALLKLWFEQVLSRGWAYGGGPGGGRALAGKHCLWVTTTGADDEGYEETGIHRHRFDAFVPAIRQTAQFCHMDWLAPLVLHDAHRADDGRLAHQAQVYRRRLLPYLDGAPGSAAPAADSRMGAQGASR